MARAGEGPGGRAGRARGERAPQKPKRTTTTAHRGGMRAHDKASTIPHTNTRARARDAPRARSFSRVGPPRTTQTRSRSPAPTRSRTHTHTTPPSPPRSSFLGPLRVIHRWRGKRRARERARARGDKRARPRAQRDNRNSCVRAPPRPEPSIPERGGGGGTRTHKGAGESPRNTLPWG